MICIAVLLAVGTTGKGTAQTVTGETTRPNPEIPVESPGNPGAMDSLRTLHNAAAIDSLRARIPSGMGEIDPLGMLVQTVIYLALVAAVLYGILRWGVPRLLGKRIVGKGALELVERLPLGGNRSVCIVRVEGRKYLVGVTDQQIRTLDVLDRGSEEEDPRG